MPYSKYQIPPPGFPDPHRRNCVEFDVSTIFISENDPLARAMLRDDSVLSPTLSSKFSLSLSFFVTHTTLFRAYVLNRADSYGSWLWYFHSDLRHYKNKFNSVVAEFVLAKARVFFLFLFSLHPHFHSRRVPTTIPLCERR